MKRKRKSLCGDKCEGCTRPCVYNIVPLRPGPYCSDPVAPSKLRLAKTKPVEASDACWRMELNRRDRDAMLGEFVGFHPDPEKLIF